MMRISQEGWLQHSCNSVSRYLSQGTEDLHPDHGAGDNPGRVCGGENRHQEYQPNNRRHKCAVSQLMILQLILSCQVLTQIQSQIAEPIQPFASVASASA
jgi:hypothetical protein